MILVWPKPSWHERSHEYDATLVVRAVGSRTVPRSIIPDRHISALDLGVYYLDQPFETEMINRLEEAVHRVDKERGGTAFGVNEFGGEQTQRVDGLLDCGKVFEEYPLQPALLTLMESLVDKDCLLGSMSAYIVNPGAEAQPLHGDDPWRAFHNQRYEDFDTSTLHCGYTVALALTDFTEANGATRIVPGSHKLMGNPQHKEYVDDGARLRWDGGEAEIINAEIKRGDVAIWDYRTWHGAGTNSTDDERRIVFVTSFVPGWFRPDENHLLLLSKDKVRGLPRRLQQLVGLSRYQHYFGHIGGKSPMAWLDADPS